jgi:hypothetical protein
MNERERTHAEFYYVSVPPVDVTPCAVHPRRRSGGASGSAHVKIESMAVWQDVAAC